MNHARSLLYFQLLSNALMGIALGIILPYTIITTAKALRYMQGFRSRLFVQSLVLVLITIGTPYFYEVVNSWFGPYNYELFLTYYKISAALFTISFAICCWLNRHALQTLLPKEEFVIEQEKRRQLLAKMLACDAKMPLARFETKNGVIISANTFGQELFGYTLSQMHKLEPGALVHPDDRARALKNVLEHCEVPYECQLITASGRYIHAEIRTTRDPSDPNLHITFVTDVTNYVQERDRRIRDLRSQQSMQYQQRQAQALDEVLSTHAVML